MRRESRTMARASIPVLLAATVAWTLFFTGCVRRPFGGWDGETVAIPVRIDWSESNIPVSEADVTGSGWVHRVSFRFFPQNGSPVFERYLEGNIFEGVIRIPLGSYKVIVMNESITDRLYWEDVVTFSDADDFDLFAATINPMTPAEKIADYPYYEPADGENVIVEPYHLASWSIDNFVVTAPAASRADLVTGSLTEIVMRRLTYNVNVSAHIKSLASAQQVNVAVRGFSDKVHIASGLTFQSPATHLVRLRPQTWDNSSDGTAVNTFLSFGREPEEPAGTYDVDLNALLVNGSLYEPDGGLVYDVTDQVTSGTDLDINLFLPENPPGDGMIELPEIEGGIEVDPWDDEEIILN